MPRKTPPAPPDEPIYLTVAKAAGLVSISNRQMYRLCSTHGGPIEAIAHGTRGDGPAKILVNRRSLERYLAREQAQYPAGRAS